MFELTKDTIIADVMRMVPGSKELFMSIGMHCLHCGAASGETIEEACMVHGVDVDTLLDELESILALQEF